MAVPSISIHTCSLTRQHIYQITSNTWQCIHLYALTQALSTLASNRESDVPCWSHFTDEVPPSLAGIHVHI